MRRHALAILAVISLVGLGVLGFGYIANFRAYGVATTIPHYVSVEANGGCLWVGWGHSAFPVPGNRMRIGNVDVYISFDRGLPDPSYALGHFGGRATNIPGYVISFPLWCLILPCTIAPILWLRRHRRRTPRGFAVEPAAEATIELPMK